MFSNVCFQLQTELLKKKKGREYYSPEACGYWPKQMSC